MFENNGWEVFRKVITDVDISNLRRIVINSGGGDTQTGRKLGAWVFEHGLDVEVVGGCFSSCANYVFVAGRNKVIHEGAFVGWHGNERQVELDPERAKNSIESGIRADALKVMPDLDAKKLQKMVDEKWKRSLESRRDEKAFFERIGLDDEFMVYGLLPENYNAWHASGKKGWAFSIGDMEHLGIKNVSYSGTGPYERSSGVSKYLMVFKLQ